MSTAPLPMEAYVAAIASLPEVGPVRLRRLLSLGPPAVVWDRLVRGRAGRVDGVDDALRRRWADAAQSIDPDALWVRCGDLGVGVTCLGGGGYPPSLVDDLDPPVVLFHLGSPDVLVAPRVAVVGTRRATPYGNEVARRLGADLAAAGVCVVSGLALGIDAAAHAGALSVRRASAWAAPAAVVGSGLDAPCPATNRRLCADVAGSGVVMSEVPPGVRAAPWRFPVRNRILAALAEVVVVVESAGAGGSMHTVREAVERGRTVLAVPGPVGSPASAGPHELLADGAGVCTGAGDVLSHLSGVVGPDAVPADPRPAPSSGAAALLERIGWLPLGVARAVELGGTDVPTAASLLAELERGGWIEVVDGTVVRCVRGGSA